MLHCSHSQTEVLQAICNDDARKLHYVKHAIKYLSANVFWDAINKFIVPHSALLALLPTSCNITGGTI